MQRMVGGEEIDVIRIDVEPAQAEQTDGHHHARHQDDEPAEQVALLQPGGEAEVGRCRGESDSQ